MRVCHVVECGGGVGNVIVDLVRAGVQAGDEFTIIYGKSRVWPEFLTSLQNIKNVKLIPSAMRREVGLHDLIDALRLYKLLRQQAPFDVINAHSSKAGALIRILRFFFPQTIVIYTPHAFMTMAPGASPIYGWIEWLLSYLCNAIICVSVQERQHAEKRLHINGNILKVIPNGIDLQFPNDRSLARKKIAANDTDFIVGFVGRLEAQKNPLCAFEAFSQSSANNPNLRLVMIGYGSLETELHAAISRKDLNNRVVIMQDLNARSLIAGFDCLLCSSDYESFGLVILEALAAGVPVVTTPVGIAEDAVVTGSTGTVTSDFNPSSLAKGITAIAGTPAEERQRISEASKARAQNFSVEKMGTDTRKLYIELINKNREKK